MLASDTSERKKAGPLSRQSTLEGHLQEVLPAERVIPYSDAAFHDTAIEWLVSTDQVGLISAFTAIKIHSITSQFKRSNTPHSRR